MSLLKPTTHVCSWTQALDNPGSLATYVAHGGYQALRRVVTEKVSGDDIIAELEASRSSERAGRLIDGRGSSSMEAKKKEGYF